MCAVRVGSWVCGVRVGSGMQVGKDSGNQWSEFIDLQVISSMRVCLFTILRINSAYQTHRKGDIG